MSCGFGMASSCNDIIVFHWSLLFATLAHGEAPVVEFKANYQKYTMGDCLADGIYPKCTNAGKDVERQIGVLQVRFAIVRGPTRF